MDVSRGGFGGWRRAEQLRFGSNTCLTPIQAERRAILISHSLRFAHQQPIGIPLPFALRSFRAVEGLRSLLIFTHFHH